MALLLKLFVKGSFQNIAGKKCKYRHALPPGFVLKSKAQKKAEEEEKNQITLEEFLETERHKLGPNLTPVTLESFTEWKNNRKSKIEAELEVKRAAKEAAFKAGKAQGMSGRDLFTFNPDLVNQDKYDDDGDDIFDLSGYKRDEDSDQEGENVEENVVHGQENDDQDNSTSENPYGEGSSSISKEESDKIDNSDDTPLVTADGVQVKEELFAEEDLDDLDDEE